MSDWIVKVTNAKMPAACRASYSVVRVLEVVAGVGDVTSVRSDKVLRVVYESEPVPSNGLTPRSGIQKALSHARDMVARRKEIETKLIADANAAARLRAEAAERRHAASRITRAEMQNTIVAKLERGEALTDDEYASL